MQTYPEPSPSPFLWGRFLITQGFQKEGAKKNKQKKPFSLTTFSQQKYPLGCVLCAQNSDGSSLATYKIK